MKRMWIVAIVAVSGFGTATSAAEFSETLQQARKACGRARATATAEREGRNWRVVGLDLFFPDHDSMVDADIKQIAELSALEDFWALAECDSVTDQGWRSIAGLPQLRRLRLPAVSEAALKSLAGPAKLDTLFLGGRTSLLGAAAASLKGFPGLRRLNLAGAEVDDASLAYIGELKNLEELNLPRDGRISDSGVAQLVGLTNLHSISLYGLGSKGESALRELPRLEVLSVSEYPPKAGRFDLSRWVRLKSLALPGALEDAGVAIQLPRNLRRLEFGVVAPGKMPRFDGPLPRNLESITIHLLGPPRERLTAADLEWLAAIPGLKDLTLECQIDDEVAAIVGLVHLRSLALTGVCGPLSDEGCKHLARLRELESLTLESCSQLTGAGIEALGELRSLKRLEMEGVQEASAIAGLASIWKLTRLEVLSLWLPGDAADGSIEKALAGTASLTNLQELTLRGRITDKMLNTLSQLKKLRRLDLSGCEGFTDEGLAALVKALPELKEVKWSYRPATAQ